MTNYEVSGIKGRANYSFAFKSIHEEINDVSGGNGDKRGKRINPRYDNKKGVLIFSTEAEINHFELKFRLSEMGLELKVLED